MTTARLTATVVGAGAGGTLSIDALIASDLYDLLAVADMSDTSRARVTEKCGAGVATFATLEEMLAEAPSDVVCVSTYAPSHLPMTRAAIESGSVRGMLVEKPLGDTTAAGREILAILKERNLPVVVPHGLMAQRAAREVIDRVRDGEIGELRLVEMESPQWDIFNAGIHWLQFFGALSDSPVEMVLTAADTSARTFRDGMQVETEAITLARTANGVRVLLNTGDHVPVAGPETVCLMRIIGSHGFIEFQAFESFYTMITPGHVRTVVNVEPYEVSGHQRHLEHLAHQIHSGERDYLIPDTSLQALEVVEAAYLSKRTGASVVLPIDGDQPDSGTDWNPGVAYSGVGGGQNGREL